MHTPLTDADTAPQLRTDLDTTTFDELIGALKAQPGYAGLLTVPDPTGRDELTIVLRQTEAQARRALADYAPAFRCAQRRLVAASARQPQ